MSHGLSAIALESLFTLEQEARTRGHSFKLKKAQSRTDPRHHFFSNRVVNSWNKLPAGAVEAKSVNEFMNALSRIKNA